MIVDDPYWSEHRPPMTGDAIICSSNTSTGLGLKTLSSSMWNHSGIVVRITPDKKISTTQDGKIYILEMNTWSRKDAISGQTVIGAGYSDYDWMSERYNILAIRPLKDQYRNSDFINRIPEFVNQHRNLLFTTDFKPFFSAWVGIPFGDEPNTKGSTMFCSELMSYFYKECLGLEMNDIFGDDGPELPNLCIPEHFSALSTPNSRVFECRNITVYVEHSDLGSVVIPVLIFTLFVLVILWTILPK